MSDPSFLLPKKVAEPKQAKPKPIKADASNKVDAEAKPKSVKEYTASKLKNDLDSITKRVTKLKDNISKHDELLKEQKDLLKSLEAKKSDLEELKQLV